MPLFTRPQAQAAVDSSNLGRVLDAISKQWNNGMPAVPARESRAANGPVPAQPATEAQEAVSASEYQAGFLPEAGAKVTLMLRISGSNGAELAALVAAVNAVPTV